jgi:hypothetical protein
VTVAQCIVPLGKNGHKILTKNFKKLISVAPAGFRGLSQNAEYKTITTQP